MKLKYIGTKLEAPEYLTFGIEAAKLGTNKSALLKELVLEFIRKSELIPCEEKSQQKGEAAAA